jgi:hypothetical protein
MRASSDLNKYSTTPMEGDDHLHDFTLNSLVISCEEHAAELKMVFFNLLFADHPYISHCQF